MANRSSIMGLHGLRNKVHKNSFDLSHRNLFTAKIGELLPCFVQELNPGDSIKVDSSYFTRTAPLQTAAFTRLRENVQFFFVPYSLLWKYFNTQVTNMTKNANGGDISRVADGIVSNQSVTTQMPYLSYGSLHSYLVSQIAYAKGYQSSNVLNEYSHPEMFNNGEYRYSAAAKLLQLLGYGNFDEMHLLPDAEIKFTTLKGDPHLSVFRLLAYQKICNDHYTYRQWQPYNASLCNIDYLKPSTSAALDLSSSLTALGAQSSDFKKLNFTDLRFSNLPLDYFNGVLPTAQYGSESVINLSSSSSSGTLSGNTDGASRQSSNNVFYSEVFDGNGNNVAKDPLLLRSYGSPSILQSDDQTPINILAEHFHQFHGSFNASLDSSLSVLALRNALAAQKYKEIQLASDADFVSQVEAHFGVRPKHDNDTSIFIGGSSSMIDINPQVNQNLAGSDDANQANVKASPVGNGSAKIKFTADTYGVVIGIYRCVPILDYAHVGIDRTLLKTDACDFVIPELDSIGMQQTFAFEVAAPGCQEDNKHWMDLSKTYGYAPRYSEYKTSYDRYNGEFCFSKSDWVTGLNVKKLTAKFDENYPTLSAVDLFNCRPDLVSSIFVNKDTLTTLDDNLFVGMVNMCYATRSLSRYGLPYSD